MKIQVCRKCGKQNVVVSGPLSQCLFCNSSDLGEVLNYDSEEGQSKSGQGIKVVIFSVTAVGFLFAGYLGWQTLNQERLDESTFITDSAPSSEIGLVDNQVDHLTNESESEVSNSASVEIGITSEESSYITETTLVEEKDSIQIQTEVVFSEPDSIQNNQQVVSGNASSVGSTNNSGVLLSQNSGTQKPTNDIEEQQIDILSLKTQDTTKNPGLADQVVIKKIPDDSVNTTNNLAENSRIAQIDKQEPAKQSVLKQQPKKIVAEYQSKQPTIKPKKDSKQVRDSYRNSIAKSALQERSKPVKLALPKAKTVTAQESNQLRNAMRKLDFNKGLVTDSKTGLMWMSCTLGMDSIGNGCYGGARELLWEEALTVSKKTSFGGYKDWRLPSIAELNSIVSCGNGRVAFEVDSQEHYVEKNGKSYNGRCLPGNSTPSIDAQVFSNTKSEGVYWTNAQSKSNSFNAWVVLFNKGLVAKYSKRLPGYVRLVRTYK